MIDREEETDLAKVSPHILSAERFGLHLATHLVSKYARIHKASVTIEQLRWARITVDGKKHDHSFLRDGDEKRIVKIEVDGSQGKDKLVGNVSAGINDLLGHSPLSPPLSLVRVLTFRAKQSSNQRGLLLRISFETSTQPWQRSMIGSLAHRSTFCTPSPHSKSPHLRTERSSGLTGNRSRVRVALRRGKAQRSANL